MCANAWIATVLVTTASAGAMEIPSLEAAWALAEEASPLRTARARERMAAATRTAAVRKALMPTVSASLSYSDNIESSATELRGSFPGRTDTSLEMKVGRRYAATAALEARWNLIDVSRWAQARLAAGERDLAGLVADRARADQRAQVARLYYAALAIRDELDLSRRELSVSDSLLEVQASKLAAGRMRPTQWRAAQDRREETASRVRHAERSDREVRRELAEALDRGVEDSLVLTERLSPVLHDPIDEPFPISPDVAEARARLETSRRRIAASRSSFLPVVTAAWQASRQVQSDAFADLSPEAKPQQVLAARLEVPISTGGDRSLALRHATIERAQLERDLESTRRRREAEDLALLADLAAAREEWEAARQSVLRREADERDAQELFASGAIPMEERMNSSTALYRARSLESTRLTELLAAAALVRIRRERREP